MREAPATAGRDPDSIELGANPLAVAVGDTFAEAAAQVPEALRVSERAMRDSSSYLVGTPQELRAKLDECWDRAGVTYFVCTLLRLDRPGVDPLRSFCTAR